MRAFDSSGNEGQPSTEIPFIIIADSAITNLTITAITTTGMTIQFQEVDGGTGLPASYDVRYDTPLIDWGTAPSVASGTCSTPVAGVTIGALLSCTITGLSTTTPYQIQIVPFRGTLGMQCGLFALLEYCERGHRRSCAIRLADHEVYRRIYPRQRRISDALDGGVYQLANPHHQQGCGASSVGWHGLDGHLQCAVGE